MSFLLLLIFVYFLGTLLSGRQARPPHVVLRNPRTTDGHGSLVPSSWDTVAEELGLGIEALRSGYSLFGTRDDCEISIQIETTIADIRVRPDENIDHDLRIARRGVSDARTSLISGDESLDRATVIDGDRAAVLAMLDPLTRELIRRFVGSGSVYVSRGAIRAELDAELAGLERIVSTVQGMVNLARRLTRPGRVEDHLLTHVADDTEAGVRLENLRVLLAQFRDSKAAQLAAEVAIHDQDLEVRRAAASFLRVEAPAAGGLSLVKDESERGALSFDRATGGLAEVSRENEDDSSEAVRPARSTRGPGEPGPPGSPLGSG